jgi:hypothetical protein
MPKNIVMMPGSNRDHHQPLHAVAADFGWTVDVTNDLSAVAAAQSHRTTVAAFFCHDALGPGHSRMETIRLMGLALPKVNLVVCHGFSETIDWPELSDAGAFHELWLPLRENEVRLCLGFVREADARAAAARTLKVVPSIPAGRTRRVHAHLAARAAR